ncbi:MULTISPECIES: hypothetical protein [unclassified Zymobacter]|uniref:hypothetical protein n=1 Tax=unclassified Zymobacter TaxID=3048685 RepID=UPI0039C1D50B
MGSTFDEMALLLVCVVADITYRLADALGSSFNNCANFPPSHHSVRSVHRHGLKLACIA